MPNPVRNSRFLCFVFLAVLYLPGLVLNGCATNSPTVAIEPVGRFDFVGGANTDGRRVPDGLSGIDRWQGNRYLAVSDRHAFVHQLEIEVDRETGEIRSATFATPVPLRDSSGRPLPEAQQGRDREGVVYDRSTGSVLIANEQAAIDSDVPSIARHAWDSARTTDVVVGSCDGPLSVFCHIRPNKGFESLTGSSDGETLWTANEQSLTVDGRASTPSRGTVVRLQRLDRELRPQEQYAYVTAPLSETTPPPLAARGVNGVTDLLLLPHGGLLALERGLMGGSSGELTTRIRIYEVDVAEATDISRDPWASGILKTDEPYVPVSKRLLVELSAAGLDANFNFEGLTLGPRLDGGDRSLLLLADNGTGTAQTLYALRLTVSP